MSEEGKKAIERTEKHLLRMLSKYEMYNDCLDIHSHYRNGDIKIILNLIEKQQKEIEELKEIEQSHKEENGKLRVELEQEKEKNKELDREQMIIAFNQLKDDYSSLFDELNQEKEKYKRLQNTEAFSECYISKDKIKEKYLEMEQEYAKKVYDNNYNRTEVKKEEMYKRQVYEELLEEV